MLKCLLAPAALLYKAGVTFRHRLFDWGILKSEKFDIPVICIGNITVGLMLLTGGYFALRR
jgi:tetraacyldisaccharide 4'-kinase